MSDPKSYKLVELTRPLSGMSGVNDLFTQVLGGVRLPIFAPEYYPTVLADIRKELRSLEQASLKGYDFQNLDVANAEQIHDLKMAELHYSMASLKPISHSAMFNISPLGWRSKATGFPLLGALQVKSKPVFGFKDPLASVFSITVDVPDSYHEGPSIIFQPNLPQSMKDLYMPTAKSLIKACGRGNTAFISAEFVGAMPPELESYIHEVEVSGVFDGLYAIFILDQVKVGRSVRVKKDPIIVGLKKDNFLGDQYFFLGFYDPEKSRWNQPVVDTSSPSTKFLLNG